MSGVLASLDEKVSGTFFDTVLCRANALAGKRFLTPFPLLQVTESKNMSILGISTSVSAATALSLVRADEDDADIDAVAGAAYAGNINMAIGVKIKKGPLEIEFSGSPVAGGTVEELKSSLIHYHAKCKCVEIDKKP